MWRLFCHCTFLISPSLWCLRKTVISLFVRWECQIWRLFCHCTFLISPSLCLRNAVIPLSIRWWFQMWRLFCHCTFLISPSFCHFFVRTLVVLYVFCHYLLHLSFFWCLKKKAEPRDCGIFWISSLIFSNQTLRYFVSLGLGWVDVVWYCGRESMLLSNCHCHQTKDGYPFGQ